MNVMRAEDLQKVMVSTWKISFVGFFPSWKITEYFYQIISYCMFPRDYFLTSFCVYLVKYPFKEKKDKKEKEEDFFFLKFTPNWGFAQILSWDPRPEIMRMRAQKGCEDACYFQTPANGRLDPTGSLIRCPVYLLWSGALVSIGSHRI